MTVATLTNKAVTAIFNASSNQYANSGDPKCILGEGERFVGSLPARKGGFQHSLTSAPRYTGAAKSGHVQCKLNCPGAVAIILSVGLPPGGSSSPFATVTG